MRLLLLLLPILTFAQFEANYNLNNINIYDDFYSSSIQDATLIGTKDYNKFDLISYGRVKSSFQSDSDENALIEYQYKSDFLYRNINTNDIKIGEGIVKGENNTYYLIELYKY